MDDARSEAMLRLAELVPQSNIQHVSIPELGGHRLLFGSQTDPIDVMLLPGEDSIWLIVPFETEFLRKSRLEILELLNDLNKDVPFGVFYVDTDKLLYRNTIRLKTLSNARELRNFVFTSLAAIRQMAKKIKTESGFWLSSLDE